jgi:hypothetical protein
MINGLWTIAELQDLLAAKDVELPALERNASDFGKTWAQIDKASFDAWTSDYSLLKMRYAAARAVAATALLAASALPDAVKKYAPADGPYQFVLLALQPEHLVTSPGSLQGLWNRLDAARQAYFKQNGLPPTPMHEPPIPQPRQGTDVDDSIIKALTPTAKDYGWIIAILGALALGVGYVKSRPSVVVVSAPATRGA